MLCDVTTLLFSVIDTEHHGFWQTAQDDREALQQSCKG